LRARLFELVRVLGYHDYLAILTLTLTHCRDIFPIAKRHVNQASVSTVHRVERYGAARLKGPLCDPLGQFPEKLLAGIGIPFDVDHHALSIRTDPRGYLVDEQLKRVDGSAVTRGDRLPGRPLHLQHDDFSIFAFRNLERTQSHSLDGSEQELADLSELASH
jgi:hypothetical protein